jgi:hypothetical protein
LERHRQNKRKSEQRKEEKHHENNEEKNMTRREIEIAAFLLALLGAAITFHAWLASHDEQQRLQSTLSTQKQIIDAADARERARDSSLNDTLAQIEKLKRSTQSPEQIVRDLPQYLSLPQPISLVKNPSNTESAGQATKSAVRQGTDASGNSSLYSTRASPFAPGSSALPSISASHFRSMFTRSHPGAGAGVVSTQSSRHPALYRNAAPADCPAPVNSISQTNSAPRTSLQRGADASGISSGSSRLPSISASRFRSLFPHPDFSVEANSVSPPSTQLPGGSRDAPDCMAPVSDIPQTPNRDMPEQTEGNNLASENSDHKAATISGAISRSSTCDNTSDCTAQFPAADLKPLYNYIQDCRACQSQLSAARQDLSDESAKVAALTRERDAAVTAAKGGPFWRRLRRDALWFVLGASAAYIASSHH